MRLPKASNIDFSFESIDITFINNLPCVGATAWEYLKRLEKVCKDNARYFGKCMYFVCTLSQKIYPLRMAELIDGELVSKIELDKVKRLNNKFKEIKEQQEKRKQENRELLKDLMDKFGSKGAYERHKHILDDIDNLDNPDNSDNIENDDISTKARKIAEDLLASIGDVSKFFNDDKFRTFLETEEGKKFKAGCR